jgi:hypothetical protein
MNFGTIPIQPRTAFRLVSSSVLLLLVWLLFTQFVGKDPNPSASSIDQKINLALRRTAHHLLRAAGDSTSRIPAVQQTDAQTFHVQFRHAFNYDQLPNLLAASLQAHRINIPYDVAVLDCTRRSLQLGYTVQDVNSKESVPCKGRTLEPGCYIVQITFTQPLPERLQKPSWPLLALGGLLTVGLLVLVWRPKTTPIIPPITPETASATPDNRLHFGNSWLDADNQLLQAGPEQHKLTYREAKLLRVLANHANQVLERDRILQLVWADEGVTVGRSIDVFVSRLRKLLADDDRVRIAAVHGVGYRFEVRNVE